MEAFTEMVDDAIAALPELVRSRLDNLEIVIEDDPSPEVCAENGIGDDDDLFGLFEGTAITEPEADAGVPFPNRIRIFRFPHLRVSHSLGELREEVRRTVHHEIAHHFGIDDDRLEEIGAY